MKPITICTLLAAALLAGCASTRAVDSAVQQLDLTEVDRIVSELLDGRITRDEARETLSEMLNDTAIWPVRTSRSMRLASS